MAFSASSPTAEPRSWSIGPLKIQIMDVSVASGDTSGTATADNLAEARWAILSGLTQTAAPTFSGNQVTVAFVDPAATRYAQLIVFGI